MSLRYSRPHTLSTPFWSAIGFVLAVMLPSVHAAEQDCPSEWRLPRYVVSEGIKRNCYESMVEFLAQESHCTVKRVELGETSVARLQLLLNSGEIDAIWGYTKTPEREKSFSISTPLGISVTRFFAHKNDRRWQTLSEPCGLLMAQARLLIPRTGNFGDELETIRHTPNCALSLQFYSEGANKAAEILMRNRADLLLSTEGWWRRSGEEIKNELQPVPYVLDRSSVHVLYHKSRLTPAFVKRMDHLIQRYIKQSGAPCHMDNP